MLRKQFDRLSLGIGRAIRRFWPVLLMAFCGTGALLWYINIPYPQRNDYDWLARLAMAGTLGMPVLTACLLWLEQKGSTLLRLLCALLIFTLTALYAWWLPQDLTPLSWFRHLCLFAAALLALCFTPFTPSIPSGQLWSFGKKGVEALLLAGLYSVFLGISLNLLLYSIEILFETDWPSERYDDLMVLITYLLGPTLFLAFFPQPGEESVYPKALRYFNLYLLAPVAILYLLVLYVYMGKILLAWEWPQGLVAIPVLGFAALGLALYLFSWPEEASELPATVRLLRRYFFYLLLPPVCLLIAGSLRRISEYGLTEERFLLIVLSAYLSGISLYAILSRPMRIYFLPVALSILLLVAAFMAYPLSRLSQLNRFQRILQPQQVEIPVGEGADTLSFQAQKELSSIADYFQSRRDLSSLANTLDLPLPDSLANNSAAFIESLGIRYIHAYQEEESEQLFYAVRSREQELLRIGDWEYLLKIDAQPSRTATVDAYGYRLSGDQLLLKHGGDSLRFELEPLLRKLRETPDKHQWPAEDLQLWASSEQQEGQLFIRSISFNFSGKTAEVQHLSGRVLLREHKK